MKIIYILLILFTATSYAQTPFITTWEAISGDLSITVPTNGDYTYDYLIDFGDGTIENNVTENITHTYAQPGIYTVSILGNFPSIYFNNEGDTDDILSVEQWGDIKWSTMRSAFNGCTNLTINATDIPDLSQVTNLALMFKDAHSFNQSINNWDVSNVTAMNGMFFNANSFNQPLNAWNVSSVTNMGGMFNLAHSFNQPLSNWDTSNVSSMGYMFRSADSFNQPINNWDVSNVLDMVAMFANASSFNQDISSWEFNGGVNLHFSINDPGFVAYCDLNIFNYDALLARFVQLGLQNKALDSQELYYCDEISHNTLVDDLGWIINYDILSNECEMAITENIKELINLYPIPTDNSLYIKIPSDIQINQVEVYNLQGEKVKAITENPKKIDVENWASGYYIIKIHTKHKIVVKEFIKI